MSLLGAIAFSVESKTEYNDTMQGQFSFEGFGPETNQIANSEVNWTVLLYGDDDAMDEWLDVQDPDFDQQAEIDLVQEMYDGFAVKVTLSTALENLLQQQHTPYVCLYSPENALSCVGQSVSVGSDGTIANNPRTFYYRLPQVGDGLDSDSVQSIDTGLLKAADATDVEGIGNNWQCTARQQGLTGLT